MQQGPQLAAPSLKAILRHITFYGLGSFLTQGLTYVAFLTYAALLPVAEFGVLAVALMVSGIITTVSLLALPAAVNVAIYQLPEEESRRYCGTIVLSVLFWSLAVAAGTTLLGPWLTPHLFHQVTFFPSLLLAVWSGFCATFASFPLTLMQARYQARTYVAFLLAQGLLQLGIIFLMLVAFNATATSYLTGLVVSQAIMAILYLSRTLRFIRVAFSPSMLRDALKLALPLMPHQVAQRIMGLVDRMVLERFASLADLGLYAFGARVSTLVSGFSGVFQQGMAPLVYQRGMEETFRPRISRLGTYFLMGVVIAALAVALLIPDFVGLLGLKKYRGSETVILLGSLALVFHALYLIPNAYLFINRKSHWIPAMSGAGAGMAVLANLLLVPRYGIEGAAVAMIAMYVTMASVGHLLMGIQVPLPFRFEPRLWRGVAVIVLVGFGVWASTLSLDSGLARLAIRAGGLSILWVGGLVAVRFFDDAEWRLVRDTARQFLSLRRIRSK